MPPERALLFVNHHARQGQKSLAIAVNMLTELGIELIVIPIRNPQQLRQSIQERAEQIDAVIIGGGDGTLNVIVDCLLEHHLPLGILPLGTANDLARTLNLPLTVPEACKVIAQGRLKKIDLGWVNGKHFFNVASLGLSVAITEKLSRGMKQRWGILAYGFTAIQAIAQNRPFRATIVSNNETIQVKSTQIAIGNGRYYGGGMAVAKDASIDDQRLDLYSLELDHWWQTFPLIWRLPKGEQHHLPWVRTLQGQSFEIHTNKPGMINTDGELTTVTPAVFRVVPKALGVFVPFALADCSSQN